MFIRAVLAFFCGVISIGLMVFLPAGSLSFFNGWLLMTILFIPMFLTGVFMMFKNPGLLKIRLNTKEKQQCHQLLIFMSAIMFFASFIVGGLNFRFGWYVVSKPTVFVSACIFIVGYILYAVVLCENTYLGRTIEVFEKHKVIDTGLYSIVRHPMYAATLLMFMSMPLVLGSVYSFIIMLAYPFIIAKRIKLEEEFLQKELDGYIAYKQKVKYRLIPFIW